MLGAAALGHAAPLFEDKDLQVGILLYQLVGSKNAGWAGTYNYNVVFHCKNIVLYIRYAENHLKIRNFLQIFICYAEFVVRHFTYCLWLFFYLRKGNCP